MKHNTFAETQDQEFYWMCAPDKAPQICQIQLWTDEYSYDDDPEIPCTKYCAVFESIGGNLDASDLPKGATFYGPVAGPEQSI